MCVCILYIYGGDAHMRQWIVSLVMIMACRIKPSSISGDLLSTMHLQTSFREIQIKVKRFSFNKCFIECFCWPFCRKLNVLKSLQKMPPSKWFNCQKVKPNASYRLICFPWCGGGSQFYARWGTEFPAKVEGLYSSGAHPKRQYTVYGARSVALSNLTNWPWVLG